MNKESENPEDYIRKAVSYMEEGKLEAAETVFHDIVKEFPKNSMCWAVFGDFYLSTGRPHLALAPLRKAAAIQPFDGQIRYLLGCAFCKQARFHRALQELEQARILFGNHPEVIRYIGWSKFMLGKTKQARRILQESVSLDPSYAPAYLDLSSTYVFLADFERGYQWLEKAKEYDPEDPFIQEQYKRFFAAKKDLDRLSKQEQEKQKKKLADSEYRKQLRVELLVKGFEISPKDKDDIAELESELKAEGIKYKRETTIKKIKK